MAHEAQSELSDAEMRAVALSELKQAAGWATLGLAILVGSLRMDRLESQNINPYTVPGLLPGLLGVVMTLLAGLLALRSWRRGALAADAERSGIDAASVRRILLVLVLCVGFDVALVGLQHPQRRVAGRVLSLRDVAVAIVIGLGAGGAITLVFQQLFLVRLP